MASADEHDASAEAAVETVHPAGTTRAVERALGLVEVVATAHDGIALSVAAREVGLALSTAGRLMRSLEARGFVWRDTAGNYRAGPRVLQIGAIAVNHLPIYQLAEPHLVDLAGVTGETSYLAVLDGDEHVLYLRQVESPQAIRHALWVGRSIPISGTAVGAALLGRSPAEGYVTARGTGIEPEAAAAAASIHDSTGRIVAAFSIIGPSFRISEASLARCGQEVARHAQLMSAELGYPGAAASGYGAL
jgi:DNA-binding IclR family transcriptional regulator